jgi:hypothetical protein
MKDDYLWDKSGEPDPEILELEEILGTLRYQPRPLELPEDLPVQRRRSYLPWVAIAATVLVALLAGIIWLNLRSNNVPQPMQARGPEAPTPQKEKAIVVTGPKETPVKPPQEVAVNHKPRNKSSFVSIRKREREREEALEAKQQLMLALRLASEKLNLAHRKTQSTPPANQIKNQHRIG